MAVLAEEVAKYIQNMNRQQAPAIVQQYSAKNGGFANQPYSPHGSGTTGQLQYQQTRPRFNNCMFCGETSHYLNSCLVAMDYARNGKCMWNSEGQIVRSNGEHVNPRRHFRMNIKERIDNWNTMNMQAKVSSNLVSISKAEAPEQESICK